LVNLRLHEVLLHSLSISRSSVELWLLNHLLRSPVGFR
jgi:hypothetical protein